MSTKTPKKDAPPAPKAADAAALIAKAKTRNVAADPSDAAMTELKKILAYNDLASWSTKVSFEDVSAMLTAHGWTLTGRDSLNSLCRRAFGRASFGKP